MNLCWDHVSEDTFSDVAALITLWVDRDRHVQNAYLDLPCHCLHIARKRIFIMARNKSKIIDEFKLKKITLHQ